MSNYTKSTNFATKDNLTPGDPLKIVRGTEIDTEYNNIATAIATKTDNASAAITGGTIDGATVGATTPATGSFTTLAASGTTTLAGALVGAVTQAAFNTTTTTLNLGGAATAVNLGAATGTATVNNTTLAAKAITASTTLAVTGTSTLTGAVTATAGVSGPITSSSVSITGGSITGITDLAVADGGTGASTAAGGLNNLLPSQTSNANKYLQTDGTNATWDAVSLSTADITGTLGVANGGTGVTTSTGTTNVVLSNSPTLVTPALGTPSALVGTNITGTASGLTAGTVTTNANLTGGVTSVGNAATVVTNANLTGAVTSVGNATSLGSFSSANLLAALTDETGTGSAVFATSPTLVTPALGTPSALVGTNITGTASGLTAGNVTTNANLTGAVTSVGNATSLGSFSSANLLGALTDETGTGSAVFATSPTLVTPILGTPTSATLTNATGLPISTGVSGLGTGIATALAVNTGSSGAPVINGGVLGTPSSGTLTNATGLPLTTGVTGTLPTANGGTNLTSFTSGGVVFASSSSVLATGGVFKFDGANVIVNATTPAYFTGTSDLLNLSINRSPSTGVIFNASQSAALMNIDGASGGSSFQFATANGNNTQPSEKMRLDKDGNLLVGVATANANGGVLQLKSGITFPATQSASSNANTLDDYEEGTWTPTYTSSSGSFGAITYRFQFGKYTKIGNVVSFSCYISTDAITVSTATGDAFISGLPFTSIASYENAYALSAANDFASNFPIAANTPPSNAYIRLLYRAAIGGTTANFPVTSLTTATLYGNLVQISGTYYTS